MVSIIIPTYNRAGMLEECLKSILAQTNNDYEILVIDDGSTDDTESRILKLSNRVTYHKLEKTGNLSFLRNYGIKHSKGEFIAFCDDDDLWHKEKLDKQLKVMNQFDFTCTNAAVINSKGEITNRKYFTDFNKDKLIGTVHLLVRNYVITSTVILRKKILPENPFDAEKYKSTAEDYDLWLKLSLNNKIMFLDEPLTDYRMHSNLTSNINNHPVIYKNGIDIISNYKLLIPAELRKYASLGIFRMRKDFIKLCISRKEYMHALKISATIFFQLFDLVFLYFLLKSKISSGTIFPGEEIQQN